MTASSTLFNCLGQALAGRYAVEEELGAGGMAVVYGARDLKHQRRVAIKLLRVEQTVFFGAERFLQEIRLTAQLQHPHILPLLDSGVVEHAGIAIPYYVMPLVLGQSLRTKLDSEGRLDVAAALRIARDVADGLDYAHARGVVHRDVKPENILLNDTGAALIADFGIAKALDRSTRMTHTGESPGTMRYMSPEQLSGDPEVGPPSDQYSLAVMVFEMLTARIPHDGSVPRRMTEAPESMAHLRSGLSADVDDAMLRALARDPTARFPSVGAFVAALERGVASRSWAPRIRRGPFLTTLGVLVLGAALMIVVRSWNGPNVNDTRPPTGTQVRRDPLVGRSDAVRDLYKRAQANLAVRNQHSLRLAAQEFSQVLREDSTFTDARGRLAYTYSLLAFHGFPFEGMDGPALVRRGNEEVDRALAADSNSAAAWFARGNLLLRNSPSASAARDALQRAIMLDPNDSEAQVVYATALRWMGEDEAGIAALHRTLALEPTRTAALVELGSAHMRRREWGMARRWFDSAYAVAPTNPMVSARRAMLEVNVGDTTAAARSMAHFRRVSGELYRYGMFADVVLQFERGDSASGRDLVERMLNELRGRTRISTASATHIAYGLLRLRRQREALAVLERAWPGGNELWLHLGFAEWDPWRQEPWFRRLWEAIKPPGAPPT